MKILKRIGLILVGIVLILVLLGFGLNYIMTNRTITKNFKEIGMPDVIVSTINPKVAKGSDGIAIANDGTIYISEFGEVNFISMITGKLSGTSIYKLTSEGEPILVSDKLVNPNGISVNSTGNVIACNDWCKEIVSVAPDGSISVIATGPFGGGVTLDENDNVYAVLIPEKGENSLVKINSEGTITEIAKDSLIIYGPGIDIDSNGTVYIADYYNPQIISVTPKGEVSIFAEIPNALVSQGFLKMLNHEAFGSLIVVDETIYVTGIGMDVIYKVEMVAILLLLAMVTMPQLMALGIGQVFKCQTVLFMMKKTIRYL